MKVTTDYGEQEIEEVIRCYNLWRKSMTKHNEIRHEYNQTEEGKTKNCQRAKNYYERHREEILAKRKLRYRSSDGNNTLPADIKEMVQDFMKV